MTNKNLQKDELFQILYFIYYKYIILYVKENEMLRSLPGAWFSRAVGVTADGTLFYLDSLNFWPTQM